MKLHFGKWQGYDTADRDVPLNYLEWLEEQSWINENLRRDLQQEIEKRSGDRPGAGKVIREGR